MKCYFALLALLLCSCAAPLKRPIEIPQNGTVAIVSNHPNYICHRNWGMTLFHNFTNTYRPHIDLNTEYRETLKATLKSAGFEVITIPPKEFLINQDDYYETDSWTADISISKSYSPHFQRLAAKYNFDAILIGTHWGPSQIEIEKENYCNNFIYRTFNRPGKREGKIYLPNYKIFSLHGGYGERIYNYWGGDLPPQNLKDQSDLNPDDLDKITFVIKSEMQKIGEHIVRNYKKQ